MSFFNNPATTTQSGFSFNSSTSFGFGQKPTSTTSAGLFGSTTSKPATGMFGSTTQPATGMFGSSTTQPATGMFGSSTTPKPATGMFGSSTTQPSTGMFGSTTSVQPSTGLFGTATTTTTASSGLFQAPNQTAGASVSGSQQKPTQTTGFSFNFAKPSATSAATSVTTTKPTTGFSLGAQPVSKTSTFQLSNKPAGDSNKPATTAVTNSDMFSFKPSNTATTVQSSLGLSLTTTTASSTTSTGLKLDSVGKPAATVATSVTSTTAATDVSGSLRFKDLEVMINKWTNELDQQEKLFIDQATHVNGWNKLLIDNSIKITELHEEFEKMICDQDKLNRDLDFIKTQQQELEDQLCPLEEALRHQSANHVSSIHTHHADLEREKTYGLVANIDGQLKQMVGDLREIIDHINTTTLPTDTTNPTNQISKILSAHMDSLQWLDSNSNSLERKLEELSKQVNDRKHEQESKFRLAFD